MGIRQKYRAWRDNRQVQKIAKVRQQNKQDIEKREVFFQSCPYLIEPVERGTDAGKYVKINNNVWAQAVIVGKQENNRLQPGFDEDFNIYAIDELIKIARVDNTAVMWAHIKIPIAPIDEAGMLGDAIK